MAYIKDTAALAYQAHYRMLPPQNAAQQSLSLPGNGVGDSGRTLAAQPGGYLDVSPREADLLRANGWLRVALVGPTANRPPIAGMVPIPADMYAQFGATPGREYLDTDLGRIIKFDGATWRDPATGSAV